MSNVVPLHTRKPHSAEDWNNYVREKEATVYYKKPDYRRFYDLTGAANDCA